MSKPNHKTRTLEWLRDKGRITSLEAFQHLGNTRLSATIWLLRKDGHNIVSHDVQVPTRYGEMATVTEYRYGGTALSQASMWNEK